MFSTILHRWISVGSGLKFDARRDLDDAGATCIEGISFGDIIWIKLCYILKHCGYILTCYTLVKYIAGAKIVLTTGFISSYYFPLFKF
jgi:hypothetical protein